MADKVKNKRVELNPLTDVPTSRSDLSLTFMLGYVKEKGTKEDKDWYIKLVEKNIENKVCHLPQAKGKKTPTPNIAVIREEFCKRFFPQFVSTKKNQSYLDLVKETLK